MDETFFILSTSKIEIYTHKVQEKYDELVKGIT
ncbi:hypothetical protein P255_01490 [Acinetobacter brisouii CIP 110357]|jgi:hypothetical protein|uniref:Uncharacterized protein n=1 Tax=Acinetobacter brisouii CIP 110357 TaxID=1341683 RepID=V2UQQ8_9GAMM|nr:hypothetical protein F954_01103 [Acinetobacter brisouii ANC 4119]ESK50990.1 hypothetical protein P255_01490 [Acinetobacter brisouii CIP 110357]